MNGVRRIYVEKKSDYAVRAKELFEEMNNKCTCTWTSQSGVNGYRVTGTNGKSIFLPAAGFYYGSSRNYVGECGRYWSSTPDESDTSNAYGLYHFDVGYRSVDWCYRYIGHTVRPVSE